MIKCIIFDFDGTLIELVDAHYLILNESIAEIAGSQYKISQNDQITIYNGLSTGTKLEILSSSQDFPKHLIQDIKLLKQKKTIQYIINNIVYNKSLYYTLSKLKLEGYKLYCASNAIIETINIGLEKLGIAELFDYIIGNDEIINKKPNSEIFLRCFLKSGLNPNQHVIIEDSKYGIEAAVRSGAQVITVNSPKDLTYDHIKNNMNNTNQYKYKDSKLNIIIPMAGSGKRFWEAGYKLPKPLIDVNGQPMIKLVIDNLSIDANYIFIIQKEHAETHHLDLVLKLIIPNCQIIYTDGLTGGACETVLLAQKFIDNNNALLIANCDQYMEWNASGFTSDIKSSNIDGAILTFKANETKWSYAKIDDNNYVNEVAEKKVISDNATCGIYWWKMGSDFVKYAKIMIEKDIRVNNEFYVCPVWNEAIADGKKIKIVPCYKMWGIGTPEDLSTFLLETQ